MMKKPSLIIFILCCCISISKAQLDNRYQIQETENKSIFSIGVFAGLGGSITKEAIKGYEKTKFEMNQVYGGSLIFIPNPDIGKMNLAFEIKASKYSFDLKEEGENFGTLNLTPIVFCVKGLELPNSIQKIRMHIDVGMGISINKFSKGVFINKLEQTYSGATMQISVDNSFVFDIGMGLSFFLSNNLCLTSDFRLLVGNTSTSWEAVGPAGTIKLDLDTFYLSNYQIYFGPKLFL